MAEVKIEPLTNEENLQEPQMSEQVFSDHVVDTDLKCIICGCLFKTKHSDASFARKDNLNDHVSRLHEQRFQMQNL